MTAKSRSFMVNHEIRINVQNLYLSALAEAIRRAQEVAPANAVVAFRTQTDIDISWQTQPETSDKDANTHE